MKSKNKIYLDLAFFSVVNLLAIMFFVWPLFNDIRGKSNDLINLKNEEFSFKEQINKLNEFNENKDNYKSNFEKAEQMLADSKNPILLIKSIENIADQSGVSLNISLSSALDKKLDKDYWSSISFQIISVGSFANTLNFLTKLENAPYLISLESLKINKNESVIKSKNNLNLNVKADYLVKIFTK